jgi:hypothetical protein
MSEPASESIALARLMAQVRELTDEPAGDARGDQCIAKPERGSNPPDPTFKLGGALSDAWIERPAGQGSMGPAPAHHRCLTDRSALRLLAC